MLRRTQRKAKPFTTERTESTGEAGFGLVYEEFT
jgi:hypothetical protein